MAALERRKGDKEKRLRTRTGRDDAPGPLPCLGITVKAKAVWPHHGLRDKLQETPAQDHFGEFIVYITLILNVSLGTEHYTFF